MADDHNNEVLMQMVDIRGNTIPAECQTEVNTDYDDLVSDYFNGTFFQVDDFSFGMNIEDRDAGSDTTNTTGGKGVGGLAAGKTSSSMEGKFFKWKSGSDADIKKMTPFKVTMNEFSIVRRYDRASPVLFEKCAVSESLQSASMVKRKVVGGSKLQSFLRFDFSDVLITHVDWADGEVIKETIKFVFRKLVVQYKTQKANGDLNPAGTVEYSYDASLRASSK